MQALPITYRGEEVGRLLLPRDGVRAQLVTRDERLLADVVRQAAAAAGRPPSPPSSRRAASSW